jgi:3-hydroxyacyl-CoA dehydrogenase
MECVGVIGAGLMGTDISLLFADAGYNVYLIDISQDALRKARKRHSTNIKEFVSKGYLKNTDSIYKINYERDIACLRTADFIFEAVTEDLKVKRDVLSLVEDFIDKNVPIATNTSSYTPTEISLNLRYPERICAMHFSNPPLVMNLVEIVPSKNTIKGVIDTVIDVSKKIGKEPVLIEKECRGFVLNRMLYAGFTEGLLSLERGDKKEDIDGAIRLLGMPFGLIEGLDLIGLDTAYKIFMNLREVYGDRFSIPQELLLNYIKRGEVGKKSGKGFYEWRDENALLEEGNPYDASLIISVTVNEAYRIINENIAGREKIDAIFKLALNVPIGIIELGEALEFPNIIEKLEEAYKKYGHEIYDPIPLLASVKG